MQQRAVEGKQTESDRLGEWTGKTDLKTFGGGIGAYRYLVATEAQGQIREPVKIGYFGQSRSACIDALHAPVKVSIVFGKPWAELRCLGQLGKRLLLKKLIFAPLELPRNICSGILPAKLGGVANKHPAWFGLDQEVGFGNIPYDYLYLSCGKGLVSGCLDV